MQFDSDHYQNRRLSSHSYSHESVILFVFFGLILRRVCIVLVKMHAATLRLQPLKTSTAGAGQPILTSNLAAVVCVCVCVSVCAKFDKFLPALISTPNVPKFLFA